MHGNANGGLGSMSATQEVSFLGEDVDRFHLPGIGSRFEAKKWFDKRDPEKAPFMLRAQTDFAERFLAGEGLVVDVIPTAEMFSKDLIASTHSEHLVKEVLREVDSGECIPVCISHIAMILEDQVSGGKSRLHRHRWNMFLVRDPVSAAGGLALVSVFLRGPEWYFAHLSLADDHGIWSRGCRFFFRMNRDQGENAGL